MWARVQGACVCLHVLCVCVCVWYACDVCGGLGKAKGGGGRVSASPRPSPTTAGTAASSPGEGDGGQPPHSPALSTPHRPCVAGALAPLQSTVTAVPLAALLSPMVRPSKPSRRQGSRDTKGDPKLKEPQEPSLPGGGCSLKWSPRGWGGLLWQRQWSPLALPPGPQLISQSVSPPLGGPRPGGETFPLLTVGFPGLTPPPRSRPQLWLGPCVHPASRIRNPDRVGAWSGPSPMSGPDGRRPLHCPACKGAWLREPQG